MKRSKRVVVVTTEDGKQVRQGETALVRTQRFVNGVWRENNRKLNKAAWFMNRVAKRRRRKALEIASRRRNRK